MATRDVPTGARAIAATDAPLLQRAFAGTVWDRGLAFFEGLAAQHAAVERPAWVGLADGAPVAFGSLLSESSYPPFRERGIPEIVDLNTAPRFRRLGVASRILDAAETLAFATREAVGIGFGLHGGYGAAQRLYVARGYAPDGNGLFRVDRFVAEGETVRLDDDLVLHLVKRRPG